MIARALAADGDVAIFAHGHILRVLAARWIELPPERGASFALDTASISELGFERENRVIARWNDLAVSSTSSGAWSEGFGPLRKLRSMPHFDEPLGDRRREQGGVDPQPQLLVEVARRGSPTR